MLSRKVAYIDLSSGKTEVKSIPEKVRRLFIGGRGLNMYLLYNHLKPGADPLGPENVLVFGAGLLTGTAAPCAARFNVSAKSPVTGFLGDSNCGGFWGPELRFAGFDHLVIKGKAPAPVYLLVTNDHIEIKDASHLWGKDTIETQKALREELGIANLQIVCIGQAGEKLVRYACVRHGYKNSAGRTGMGAVMGSKNLKAIAVRGTKGIEVAFPGRLLELRRAAYAEASKTKLFSILKEYGTPFLMDAHQGLGNLPVRNNQRNQMEEGLWEDLSMESLKRRSLKMNGCFGCFVHCRHSYRVPFGQHKGAYAEGPEYFAMNALGPRIGNYNLDVVLVAHDLCNRAGLDTTDTGGNIAWAMELYQRGIIDEGVTDGLPLEWGDAQVILKLIEKIIDRDGFGRLLGEGGIRAYKEIGEDSLYYFMHVKGLSIEAEERGLKGCALNMATASRGADHLRSRPVPEGMFLPPEVLAKLYHKPVPPDPHSYQGKPWMVTLTERRMCASDLLGICKFLTKTFMTTHMFGITEYATLLGAATGWDISPQELDECTQRVITLERMFNIREGLTRADDTLPERYFEERTPNLGPLGGTNIDREKFAEMLDEYYELHGWNRDGMPATTTLSRLGLDREPSHLI